MTDWRTMPARQLLGQLARRLATGAKGFVRQIPTSEIVRAIADLEESFLAHETETWTPFQLATIPDQSENEEKVAELIEATGMPREAVVETLRAIASAVHWRNALYQVTVRKMEGGMVHLSIKRLDQRPIHNWRHLQRIKDEILGPEMEAVELYPANSRLADSANQYHLWGVPDSGFRFPFGFTDRLVLDHHGGDGTGAVQEGFQP